MVVSTVEEGVEIGFAALDFCANRQALDLRFNVLHTRSLQERINEDAVKRASPCQGFGGKFLP